MAYVSTNASLAPKMGRCVYESGNVSIRQRELMSSGYFPSKKLILRREFSAVDRAKLPAIRFIRVNCIKGNSASLMPCGNSIFLTALYPENYPLRVISAAKYQAPALLGPNNQRTKPPHSANTVLYYVANSCNAVIV